MKAKTTKTKAPTDKLPKPKTAPADAFAFSWEDAAPGCSREDFGAVHRFTTFADRFFLAFGFDVNLDFSEKWRELLNGGRIVCRSFAERQFWLGLCIYAVRFEQMAQSPKVERPEVERAADRAVAHVEAFKKNFPDLWRNADERAFLAAFDLELEERVNVELEAPLWAIHNAPAPTPAASAPPAPPTKERRAIVTALEEGSWLEITTAGQRKRYDISGRKQWEIIDRLIYAPEPGWVELPRNWRSNFRDETRNIPGKAEAFAKRVKAGGRGRSAPGRFRLT